jgi:8-amino-7-oxononanoate synthase
MFTASLPPSIVASVRAALRIVRRDGTKLRKRLWDNVATLYDGLAAAGFRLGPEHGPVVAVVMPDQDTTVAVWRALLGAGIYVNVAIPPATPGGLCLLRCSLSAAHSRGQLQHMVETLTDIGRRFGLVSPPRVRAAAAG